MTWILHAAPIPANSTWYDGNWFAGGLLGVAGLFSVAVLLALLWRERRRATSPAEAEVGSLVDEADATQVPRAAA